MPARRPALLRPIPAALAALWLLASALTGGCGDGHAGEPPADAAPSAQPVGLVPPAPRPTGALPPDASCVTAGCHATFGARNGVHGVLRSPAGCAACHGPDEGGHVYPLLRPGTATCTFCHGEVAGGRLHAHAPVESDCLACHDPHASEHGALLRAPLAQTCAACHPPESFAQPHAPFARGECTACHDPHQSDFARLLRGGDGPEHCYLCHEETHAALAKAAHVHPPAAEDCLLCHRPHGTEHARVLAQEIDAGCISCHGEIETLLAGVTAPHGAMTMGDRCANCHDAHAANHEKMLKDRQDVLCLRCHGQEIRTIDGRTIPDMTPSLRDRAFLHGPVESGDCAACHTVHGGTHSQLLQESFPERFYASFDLSQYALCFRCHDSALVTEERTAALTNFRDGDVNLHYLHVNREEKGRTCRACHEIHGSDLPAHVAESVPFGNAGWSLPIGFVRTDTGGSCAPGCHKPLTYDRVEPTLGR